ncbi:MAG: DUF6145 family protein [Anaerotignaceae bacterium]
MEERITLAGASFDKEKYYFNTEFAQLPDSIQAEVKEICIMLAHKLMCTFLIGFYKDGSIFFETTKSEELIDFDDIGAELEIKALKKEKAEFIKSLSLWYVVFKTQEGSKIREELLKK